MQPLQLDLRRSAAKDTSYYYARSHASKKHWCSHSAVICRDGLQSTFDLRATATEIAAPKPDPGTKANKKTILKHFFKRNTEIAITNSQTLMQPFQCKLRTWIAKHNGTAHWIISLTLFKSTVRCRMRPIPSQSRTRCTNKVPHVDTRKHFVRESIGFCAFPPSPTSAWRSDPIAICSDCFASWWSSWWCGDSDGMWWGDVWDEVMWGRGDMGMWCGDVVMLWCGGVVTWWCGDVVMWWCGDVVMWWCWWCGDYGD